MRCSALFLPLIGAIASSAVHGQPLRFLHQFPSSTPPESASLMAIDPSGIYIAGGIGVSTILNPPLTVDSFIRKTDKTGGEIWSRRFGGSVLITGMAASSGGIYVAGETGWNIDQQAYFSLPGQTALGWQDAFVRRYDQDGNELWTRQFGTENSDFIYGAAADSTGVYVVGRLGATYGSPLTGQPFVRKYDPDGREVWIRQFDSSYDLRSIAATDGAVYVGGRFVPPGADPAFLRKYDASGTEVWTRQFGTGAYVTAQVLAANATGVYLNESGVNGAFLDRYDSDGNRLWAIPPISSYLVLDDTGFYTGGSAYRLAGQCAAGAGDAFVSRYDLDGHKLWARQFGTWQSESATTVAVDATGVYATGTLGSGVFLAKIEKEPVIPTAGRPEIRNECVLNSASFEGGAVTPGELVTILGSGLGPAQVVSQVAKPGEQLPTMLGGTRVLVNGTAAPLLAVSDQQVNAVVPDEIEAGSNVDIQVEYHGIRSTAVSLPVLDLRLGLFQQDSSATRAILLNEDGTLNSPTNPAPRGSIVRLFATGAGPIDPAVPDGQILSDPPPHLQLPAKLYFSLFDYFDCEPTSQFNIDALFAGGVPGSVNGLVQIQAQLPASMTAGTWDLVVKLGGPFAEGTDPYLTLSVGYVPVSVR
jgi:uncharacterized protein (TIGR03437 family)